MKKFNNIQNKCIKGEDNKEYWISRSVAVVGIVSVIVNKEVYVLIGKRGSGAADYQGQWNLPCGYLDWNETGVSGCLREIYEETGLDFFELKNAFNIEFVTNAEEQPIFVDTRISRNKQNVELFYLFKAFLNKDDFNKVKYKLSTLNSEENEVDELKFIKKMELKEFSFAFNHEKVIESMLSSLQIN